MREEIRKIQSMMESAEYVTDAPLATSVHLALQLKTPPLVEGHAGVAKTEVAQVMSRVLGTHLTRLQRYAGLDAATSVHLDLQLKKPLLIEGHAGVGKTEVAKVMSRVLGTNLIRLQCYEGLDASTALYEWNYQKQLLHIKRSESSTKAVTDREHEI